MPDLQALFEDFFSQHARLIELKTALPEAALLVERFSGREAVSENYRFCVDCVSPNAYRFERDPVSAAGHGAAHVRHKLILFDRAAELPECSQSEMLEMVHIEIIG